MRRSLSCGIRRAQILSVSIALLIALNAVPVPAASIEAHFADGNGNGTGSVDRYAGVAGNGWTSEWKHLVQGVVANSVGAASATPLITGGGTYLSVAATSGTGDEAGANGGVTSGSTKGNSVARAYGNIGDLDLAQPHIVSFLYRLDAQEEFNTTTDYIVLTDQASVAAGTTDTSTSSTWVIRAYGADSGTAVANRWAFYNGDLLDSGLSTSRFVDSAVPLVLGNTYRFEIESDPTTRTYVATVEDLVTGASYTSGDLGYRNNAATSAAGALLFGYRRHNLSGLSSTFSVDDIEIAPVPEPATGAVVLGALAMGLLRRPPGRRSDAFQRPAHATGPTPSSSS